MSIKQTKLSCHFCCIIFECDARDASWRKFCSYYCSGLARRDEKSAEQRKREYYLRNRERILKKVKVYQQQNAQKRKDYQQQWYKNNSENIKARSRLYYQSHREELLRKMRDRLVDRKEERRMYFNAYKKRRRSLDPKYALSERIGTSIRNTLRHKQPYKHWEELVGYTKAQLINRLSRTMPKGYGWEDFLAGRLHIDHIVPISAHNFSKETDLDFKRCWGLKNLRLLPATENLAKWNKLENQFQPALGF